MGKEVFDDTRNAYDDVTEVDLYKVIEFNANLPGTSQLTIDLMDKNDFRFISDFNSLIILYMYRTK